MNKATKTVNVSIFISIWYETFYDIKAISRSNTQIYIYMILKYKNKQSISRRQGDYEFVLFPTQTIPIIRVLTLGIKLCP